MKKFILSISFVLFSVITFADNSGDKPVVEDLPKVYLDFKNFFQNVEFSSDENFEVIIVFIADDEGNVTIKGLNTNIKERVDYIKKAMEKNRIEPSSITPGKKYVFRLVYNA